MAAMRTRRLAWAFLFLLAMHEVSAHREAVDMMSADALAASTLAEGTRVNDNIDAMKEAQEFKFTTHWAKGKESKLRWKLADLTVKLVKKGGGGPQEVVQLTAGNEEFTIMPDAAVVSKTVNGMATVSIAGWKKGNKDPVYKKNDAIYIRTERNPFIGLTKDSWKPWRYAGYKIYQDKGYTKKPYYINKDGKMFVIEWNAVKAEDKRPVFEDFKVHLSGRTEVMKRPDSELMLMVDTMLGEASCLGNPSKCAYRCVYNPEQDSCSPSSFCEKVSPDTMAGGRLAPFGKEQKCMAKGSDADHELADMTLAGEVLEDLRARALDLAVELEKAESVPEEKADGKTQQKTLALFTQASDILSTFQSLPARLTEKQGNFKRTRDRVALKDFAHWRSGAMKPAEFKNDYKTASDTPISKLRVSDPKSPDFLAVSVPAKLHSELVKFLVRRPKVMIEAAKQGSKGKCVLADKTSDDQKKFHKFIKYYMNQPGFGKKDARDHTTGLGEECEKYLIQGVDEDVMEKADVMQDSGDKDRQNPPSSELEQEEEEEMMDGESMQEESELENKVQVTGSEHLPLHLEGEMAHADGQAPKDFSVLQQQQTEAEEAEFVFILFAIVAAIILACIAGAILAGSGMALGRGNNLGFFCGGMLGGFLIAGCFCMAPWLGFVVLAASVIGFVVGLNNDLLAEVESTARSLQPESPFSQAHTKQAMKVKAEAHPHQVLSAALHLGA